MSDSRRRSPWLQLAGDVGGAPQLVEVRAGRDELDLVGADRFELSQHRQQLVFTAQPVIGAIASTYSAGIQFI